MAAMSELFKETGSELYMGQGNREHDWHLIPHRVSLRVTKADKLWTAMRRNSQGDWTIDDVRKVCNGLGW